MVVLTSLPPPTEGIKIFQPNTQAHFGKKDLGKGTLYIAESRLSWVSDAGQGFSLEYPAISLHAVSRDQSAFPQDCLYLMIEAKLDDSDHDEKGDVEGTGSDNEDDANDESDNITEIRFIPDDKNIIDALFHSMSECQSLHPDPEDSLSDDENDNDDEDEDDDNAYGDGIGTNGNFVGRTGRGSDFEPMDVSQFEDAEDNVDQ